MPSLPSPLSTSPVTSPRLRVLVVEDEALLRWAITESLAAQGHTIAVADDGASALRLVEHLPLDVILLDYRLPDSNGLSLLSQLRRLSPRSPVVMMTACNSPQLTEGATAMGAYRVMDKPFEMQALEACLQEAYTTRPA